jgi:hypothetical protein
MIISFYNSFVGFTLLSDTSWRSTVGASYTFEHGPTCLTVEHGINLGLHTKQHLQDL